METIVSSTTKTEEEAEVNDISSSLKMKFVKNGQEYYVAANDNKQNTVNSTGTEVLKKNDEKPATLKAWIPKQWLTMSQQISSSIQQSLVYRPIPLWPVDMSHMNGPGGSATVGSSTSQPVIICQPDMTREIDKGQFKYTNKDLNKTNGSGLPLPQNCLQQEFNYFISNDNNPKNDSINGSNIRNSNVSYSQLSVQSEPTYAINSLSPSYNQDKSPLMKQLLSKNYSHEKISGSRESHMIGLNQVQGNNYMCLGQNHNFQNTGQTTNANFNYAKQTNCVSTQTEPVKKSSSSYKQINSNQLSTWQMNRAVKAYLIFSNETKSKILYKDRTTTCLSPTEELDIEQKLKLMWNSLSVETKRHYLQRAVTESPSSFGGYEVNKLKKQLVMLPTGPCINENQIQQIKKEFIDSNKYEQEPININEYIKSYVSSKRQKVETYWSSSQTEANCNVASTNNYENELNNDIIIEYVKPMNKTSTIASNQLNDMIIINQVEKKRSLFCNVEELARPHQSIALVQPITEQQVSTTITLATPVVATTERSDNFKNN